QGGLRVLGRPDQEILLRLRRRQKENLKTVHAGAGRITPMESDAPVAEDLAYGSMAADPQMSWDVEPGLQSSP
ncbi:MAG: hypothetical protein GY859_24365, partial [Desulfobacterales bacterium]|nr:hypothetical protein [Desulfobacterales bacterium]